MAMSQSAVKGLAREFFPSFLAQRQKVKVLDLWARGKQLSTTSQANELNGQILVPESATREMEELRDLAPSSWAGLIITELAQTATLEGVRRPGSEGNMECWNVWQENRWDGKQASLYRAAIGHGLAFGGVFRAKNRLTKKSSAKMQAYSAMRMAAWYDEDDDEFPLHALMADPIIDPVLKTHNGNWSVRVIDEEAVYTLTCEGNGLGMDDWTFISYEPHGFDVPPIVRYANRMDLDGNATGEIEPVIPMLRRLDQSTYDRLIVQRYGAWKVRWIAGMAKPSTDQAANLQAMELSVKDILISTSKDTKFGTLDATDPKAFSDITDADLRYLAAITQTPPHHLLGLSSNLQAEALAAAEAGLQRKSIDFKTITGESHEQMFRLVAEAVGNSEEALATDMKVRWKDTESRSLVQTANALTLLAQGLGIPSEMLWERLPGWGDDDSERAKRIIEKGGIDQLLKELDSQIAIEQAKATKPTGPNGEGGSQNEPKK